MNRHKKSKHQHYIPQSLSAEKCRNQNKQKDKWPLIALVIIILFTAAIRIRLLEIPLERDEGEFAYMGQLMLQGIPPYLIAYNMKLPGIYAIYALIMAVFGQTIAGIHLGLIVANSAAIVLLFFLTRYLFDYRAAIVAAICYALLSLSPQIQGTSAHATQFIVPFALAGTILLLKAIDSKKFVMFFLSGLLFGIAFMVKQHAVFFILFASVYLIIKDISIRPFNWKLIIVGNFFLAIGFALPFFVACIVLYQAGVFSRFWFWTFTYAGQYVSIVSLSMVFENLVKGFVRVIDSWALLWILAGVGLTAIFWYEKAKQHKYFILAFCTFSFFTICPGFYFRRNYFVTLLPAISLLAGIGITALAQWLYKKKFVPIIQTIPFFIVIITIMYPVIVLGDFFFELTPIEACRIIYSMNPFPESVKIAEYIKNHTTENDRIAIMGSEMQICFYAKRKSTTGYISTYGLMEPHPYASKMQLEMINEFETSKPKYAVIVNVPTSWSVYRNSDTTIIEWLKKYYDQNYKLVGLIDLTSGNSNKIYWDEEAKNHKPSSPYNLLVVERK
jgi:hypothetical protein